MAGPRSDPPITMLTTVRIRSPVCPVQAPLRTRCGDIGHPVEDLVDVVPHVLPIHLAGVPPTLSQVGAADDS
jgi:hypothetical protein